MPAFPSTMTKYKSGNQSNSLLSWLKSNKFYTTTPISGFTLIINSKFKWEVVLWYILLFFFSCLTILNVSEVTSEYNEQKTVTSVNVIDVVNNHKERKFGLPNFYMRIQVPNAYFLQAQNQNAFLLEKLNSYNDSYTIMNGSWSGEMILLFMIMNDFVIRGNTRVTIGGIRRDFETRNPDKYGIKYYGKDLEGYHLTELQNPFERLLAKETGDIYTKFTEELANYILDGAYGNNESNTAKEIMRDVAKFELLYFHFSTQSTVEFKFYVPFHKPETRLILGIQFGLQARHPGLQNDLKLEFFISFEYFPEIVNLDISLFSDDKLSETSPNVSVLTLMDVKSHWHTQLACDEDHKGYDDCSGQCEGRVTDIHYGCLPPLINLRADGSKYCSYWFMKKNYSQYFSINYVDVNKCKEKCREYQECARTTRTYKVIKQQIEAPFYMFFYSQQQLSVFVYEEYERVSLSGFLAELGGAMDLWVGASVIGFIHLCVYIIKQIIYIFNRNSKPGATLRGIFKAKDSTAVVAPGAIALNASRGDSQAVVDLTSDHDDTTRLIHKGSVVLFFQYMVTLFRCNMKYSCSEKK